MKPLKNAVLISTCTLIILTSFFATAYAITGSYQPYSTPYVCIVVLFSDNARTNPLGYCSGVLISPSVILTAGHGTFEAAAVSVCFDKGPIDYSIQDGKMVYSDSEVIYTGTPITYPQYAIRVLSDANNGNNLVSCSDIGLIILDTPVTAITDFPKLPPAGFTGALDMKTNLKELGYGFQLQVTPKDSGVTNSWVGTLSCNSATAQLVSGNFAGSDNYLRLTANPSQGKGGVAFGDSGGPVIYNTDSRDMVLAINAYVNSANCNGVTYHTRIDTSQVLDWINRYLI